MKENEKFIVQACGVVYINSGSNAEIRVNGKDLISQIYNKIFDEIRPETDWNCNFAGRILIEVEIMGDRKD